MPHVRNQVLRGSTGPARARGMNFRREHLVEIASVQAAVWRAQPGANQAFNVTAEFSELVIHPRSVTALTRRIVRCRNMLTCQQLESPPPA